MGVLSVKLLQINGGTDNDATVEVGNILYVDRVNPIYVYSEREIDLCINR